VTSTRDSAAVAVEALLAVLRAEVAVRLALDRVVDAERAAALRLRVAAAFWALAVRREVVLEPRSVVALEPPSVAAPELPSALPPLLWLVVLPVSCPVVLLSAISCLTPSQSW
jgi:hypothetical protein